MALTIPNRFTNGQTIDAVKFNSNFDAISAWASGIDTDLDTAEAAIDAIEAGYGSGAFFAYAGASDQSISATTYTTVTLSDTGTDAFDTSSYFASNVYTPTVAGAYHFAVNLHVLTSGFADAETVNVYITKNTSTRYQVASLLGTNARGCSGSIILKANGTTDTFKVEVYASGDLSIDYAQFSGFCVKPD